MGLYFCFCHLILNFHLETFPENSFNLFHSDWISTWCCVDVLRTVLSLTDYSSDGDWYTGPIWLTNSCILSCTMLPTTALLKPDVPDVRWLLRRSSSCWVMNGTKFAYVLSISSFCARFWVFHWKLWMHVHCCSRGEEVDCHWLFHCLLPWIIFHCWAVERGHKLV